MEMYKEEIVYMSVALRVGTRQSRIRGTNCMCLR